MTLEEARKIVESLHRCAQAKVSVQYKHEHMEAMTLLMLEGAKRDG